jgi:hypothetical protein
MPVELLLVAPSEGQVVVAVAARRYLSRKIRAMLFCWFNWLSGGELWRLRCSICLSINSTTWAQWGFEQAMANVLLASVLSITFFFCPGLKSFGTIACRKWCTLGGSGDIIFTCWAATFFEVSLAAAEWPPVTNLAVAGLVANMNNVTAIIPIIYLFIAFIYSVFIKVSQMRSYLQHCCWKHSPHW